MRYDQLMQIVDRLNEVTFKHGGEECCAMVTTGNTDAITWNDIPLWDDQMGYQERVEVDEEADHPNYEDCRASLIELCKEAMVPFVLEAECEAKANTPSNT